MRGDHVGLETVQYLKKLHLEAVKKLKKAEKEYSKLKESSPLYHVSVSERRITMIKEEISDLEMRMVKSWK